MSLIELIQEVDGIKAGDYVNVRNLLAAKVIGFYEKDGKTIIKVHYGSMDFDFIYKKKA